MNLFQFHTVQLRLKNCNIYVEIFVFQFHNGTIKTVLNLTRQIYALRFKYQNVRYIIFHQLSIQVSNVATFFQDQ